MCQTKYDCYGPNRPGDKKMFIKTKVKSYSPHYQVLTSWGRDLLCIGGWRSSKCVSEVKLKKDSKGEIVSTKVPSYEPKSNEFAYWGKQLLCNKYNRGNTCLSDIKVEQKTEKQIKCDGHGRWINKVTSVGGVTAEPLDVLKKCKYDGKYSRKRLTCYNVDFTSKYQVVEQFTGLEDQKRDIELKVRAALIFDVTLPKESGRCTLKPVKNTSYFTLNGPLIKPGDGDLSKQFMRWTVDQIYAKVASEINLVRKV